MKGKQDSGVSKPVASSSDVEENLPLELNCLTLISAVREYRPCAITL